MKKMIREPADAAWLDHRAVVGATGHRYRRQVDAPTAQFAAPSADLQMLVIAEALKRKAQAELQREVLRDALYEMPAQRERTPERNDNRGARIRSSDSDD